MAMCPRAVPPMHSRHLSCGRMLLVVHPDRVDRVCAPAGTADGNGNQSRGSRSCEQTAGVALGGAAAGAP